jgi:hypothetical protein
MTPGEGSAVQAGWTSSLSGTPQTDDHPNHQAGCTAERFSKDAAGAKSEKPSPPLAPVLSGGAGRRYDR